MTDDRAYRAHVHFDAETQAYRGIVPELDISVEADTRAEAIAAAEAAIEARVEEVATSGERLPPPIDAAPPQPGEITLALNGGLFRELQFQAQRAGVEPAELALQLIARGIGQLETGRRPQRAPKPAAAERPAEAKTPDEDEDRQPESNESGGQRNRGRGGKKGRGNNRNQGGRRREGYRPEMENQADFLAYVRDMEKGGGRRR